MALACFCNEQNTDAQMPCDLCEQIGGELLWSDDSLRVVLIDHADCPGFCRVIWSTHVKEMTDLTSSDRMHFMAVVFAVENCLRTVLQPNKINLASLGNQTPHLHWHVIPRWNTDRFFPNPIWAPPVRESFLQPDVATKLDGFRTTLVQALFSLDS